MPVFHEIKCIEVPTLGNLNAYIRATNIWPLLSFDEEQLLSKKFYRYGDLYSIRILILSHLRFVVHITKSYYNYGLLHSDLIQEGNIGLMKAIRKFNPYIGVRLVSFAVHWIKSEIHEYVLRNWKIVKVATTKSQRKLFFNLRKKKKKIGWLGILELKIIAKSLGVNRLDVKEMEQRMFTQDVNLPISLNNLIKEKNTMVTIRYLKDGRSNFANGFEKENWYKHIKNKLIIALSYLDERSRNIINSRWLNRNNRKITLQKIANYYGISAERVRQLEQNAIKKLRIFINN
ncbi:RNA polymerase sigma factor RpoH [Buchnera aphidicola (Mollitrichosiphum nigrofasciatum)]|uniref:RNA polymerase sigma factor RpoH n=1 Tax=Buchnera aphidicola TaxID=9 RepID=UPI0031B7FE65